MEARFQVRLDEEANALYFRLEQGTVARTVEISPTVFLDIDENNRPLGLEFIDADDFLDFVRKQGGTFDVPTPFIERERIAV